MRHRGRALLFFAEKLFRFANFGALQVADLGGDLVERGGDYRQGGEIVGVAVALDHLRTDCGSLQSQASAYLFFQLGSEVGEDADCAGELSDAHVLGSGYEAGDIALGFGIPVGNFEAERDGLGVNAVSAPDHGSVFEFPGAAFENFGKALEVLCDDLRGLADQERLRCVDDVVRGQSVVEPAGMGANDFGDRGGEGDDVVADLGFDFVDAIEPEVSALLDGLGSFFGNQPGFGESFGGGDFDGKPGAEAVFVAPDAGHLGAGIAGNHVRSPRPAGTEDSKWAGGIRLVLPPQSRGRAGIRCTTGATEEHRREKSPISHDHRTREMGYHDLPQFGIVEDWVYFPILYRRTI